MALLLWLPFEYYCYHYLNSVFSFNVLCVHYMCDPQLLCANSQNQVTPYQEVGTDSSCHKWLWHAMNYMPEVEGSGRSTHYTLVWKSAPLLGTRYTVELPNNGHTLDQPLYREVVLSSEVKMY